MSPWSAWRAHFEASADRPRPLLPTDLDVPDEVRAPLTRTLAIFQRGEVGEGRIAHEVRRARLAGLDDDYHRALDLFVREEGRHAVLLATALRALGSAPRDKAMAEVVFRTARRAVDVRHELLVLLAAEVVAVVFYDALARGLEDRLGPSPLSELLFDLVADEHLHLDFHTDFFRQMTRPRRRSRLAFRARWWTIGSAACGTVLVDHRETFRVLGLDRADLIRRVRDTLARVDAGVHQGSALAYGPRGGAAGTATRVSPGPAGLEPATPGTKNRCSAS